APAASIPITKDAFAKRLADSKPDITLLLTSSPSGLGAEITAWIPRFVLDAVRVLCGEAERFADRARCHRLDRRLQKGQIASRREVRDHYGRGAGVMDRQLLRRLLRVAS